MPAVRYLERFQHTLIDPTWAEIVEREPLMALSHYLAGRISVLCVFADEIIENLDKVRCHRGFLVALLCFKRKPRFATALVAAIEVERHNSF